MAWDREKDKQAGKALGIGSSVFGILFAVFWCVGAASIGAWFMLLFGIPFAGMMIYRLYVCIQFGKADKETPQPKERDPWERPEAVDTSGQKNTAGSEGKFCPYCGGSIQNGFTFCPKCGRRQP